MIVIDGAQTPHSLSDYENLEQAFDQVVAEGLLGDRVVTDVLVDGEPFTEIYPHQSEDIATADIQSLEIKSRPVKDMAVDITRELYKVVTLMSQAGRRVAELFRQAEDAEALETYQDLLDVTRNFIVMIGVLRNQFALHERADFSRSAKEFDELFGEMMEVLENEDWILLADLMEYEFLPTVDRWKQVIATLRDDIRHAE